MKVYSDYLEEYCKNPLGKKIPKDVLKKHRLVSPVVDLSGCNQCGQCCEAAPIVQLTLSEAVLIATHIGKPMKEIFEIEGEDVFMVGKCRFLNKIGDKAYCSIHAIKPEHCKSFPVFELDGEEFVTNHYYCEACLKNSCEAIKRGL